MPNDMMASERMSSDHQATAEAISWLQETIASHAVPAGDRELYRRYVRALAVLCECAPYVDDQDYIDLIDDVLAEACRHYPLQCNSDGDQRGLTLLPASSSAK